MTTTGHLASGTAPTGRPSFLCERDVEAVAEFLDPWITAVTSRGEDVEVPLLGTQEWADADTETRLAAVAVFVIGCLVEREPIVIAARLAAEVATLRASRMAAARQASHAISAAGDWSAVARRIVQRGNGDELTRRPR
ncbi:MAG: hypothetical protein J0I34_33675 [Pseudonocardia sp.]|uniref:DUF2742 domain-containing protein n=1 Tax=unclassified Pseudonocardia TaxID=2619320 RepID=UPI00086ABB2B|nr:MULTISPECIES: DUF2742 domain-containing protein [unclassified Pseudonocardia]MBN9113709.1 hypothetical protein [Pseudonocardia sp.]ODU21369.1 MAG: hypothetical protein ABS80_17535 [Pseudonocardia sp. SCN 72-51]ODU98929.1 MAG: hypothetical protein ABT15_32930 [Pseudonocardia sp. SCN 73-27]